MVAERNLIIYLVYLFFCLIKLRHPKEPNSLVLDTFLDFFKMYIQHRVEIE